MLPHQQTNLILGKHQVTKAGHTSIRILETKARTPADTHTYTYTGSRTARWTVKGDERNDSLSYHTTLVKAITPSAEHEINLARV